MIFSLDPKCARPAAGWNAERDGEFTEFTTGALLPDEVDPDPELVADAGFPTVSLPTNLDPEFCTRMTCTKLDPNFAADSESNLGPFINADELAPESGRRSALALNTVCGSDLTTGCAAPLLVTEDAAEYSTGAPGGEGLRPESAATAFAEEIAMTRFLPECPTELKSDAVAEAVSAADPGTGSAEKSWLRMDGGAERRCFCRRRAEVRLLL